MKTLKYLATAALLGLWVSARAQNENPAPATSETNDATQTGAAPAQNDTPNAAATGEMPPPPPDADTTMDSAPLPGEGDQSQAQNQTEAPRQPRMQSETNNANEGGNPSDYVPPANAKTNGPSDLRLNFRNTPIEMVLNYLSDAAGFIIELDTHVSGRVDIWSNQPVTKEEAVLLLNSVLNKNGYAVVRNGRVLRVMNRDDALHSDIPVNVGGEPKSVPKTDEIVTQIIPIRFVEAKQLIADLSPLVSSRATIIANEAGNSIIVTDTQANIRHLMEVIKAIDSSAEDVTEVRVFHLEHHDPVEVANMLTSLFADSSSSTGSQTPIQFGGRSGGGPGGFFARMMGGQGQNAGGSGGNNQNSRIKKRNRVVAVADQRTQSVIVTASSDLIGQIGDMVTQIDRESPKVSRVSVVHLDNADPQQVQQVLQDMFQSGNTRNTRNSSQNSPLMTRSQQATQTGSSTTTSSGFGNSSAFGGGNNANRSFGQ